MKKIILAVLACSIYSFLVFAAGTMQLEGKIVSVTKDKIEVNDTKHIYLLLRNKLRSNNQVNLASLKPGQAVNLTMPFEAIESTKVISNHK